MGCRLTWKSFIKKTGTNKIEYIAMLLIGGVISLRDRPKLSPSLSLYIYINIDININININLNTGKQKMFEPAADRPSFLFEKRGQSTSEELLYFETYFTELVYCFYSTSRPAENRPSAARSINLIGWLIRGLIGRVITPKRDKEKH